MIHLSLNCTLVVRICPWMFWNVLVCPWKRSSCSLLSVSSLRSSCKYPSSSTEKRPFSYVKTLLWLFFRLDSCLTDCLLLSGVSKWKKFLSKMAMSFDFWDTLWTVEPKLNRDVFTEPYLVGFILLGCHLRGMSTHPLDWTHRWGYGIVRVLGKLHSLALLDPCCSICHYDSFALWLHSSCPYLSLNCTLVVLVRSRSSLLSVSSGDLRASISPPPPKTACIFRQDTVVTILSTGFMPHWLSVAVWCVEMEEILV